MLPTHPDPHALSRLGPLPPERPGGGPPGIDAQIVVGRGPDVLSRVTAPGVELAIWRRRLPASLGRWLADVDPACFPDGRILATPHDLPAAIDLLVETSALPAGPERQALADDVFALARSFASILGAEAVDIRLEALAHDACWRFHRDHVSARLVTTYVGPGTEWVHPAEATRAIEQQKDYAGPLERLAAGDVALFRGCHPGTPFHGPDQGIVHRSPPIAGSGLTRLFLCLNLPSPASPPLMRRQGSL